MLDMDEMLLSIKNTQIKKYLEEAVKSYKVGNYRSAIITSWIAAMFDLVEKFQILVQDRESRAKDEWAKIEPDIKEHKNWETRLLQAAKTVDMISEYELKTLENLRETRNKYAHPSFDEVGKLFDPTPEEVRYFIRTLFDLVLSQPAQLGAFYVNKLLEDISNPNFLYPKPNIDNLALSKDSVLEKFNRINKKQVKRLIKELFKHLLNPVSSEHELNILCFTINLWGCSNELQISENLSTYIDDYIESKKLKLSTLLAILSYPEAINQLSERSKSQIADSFKTEIILKRKYPNLAKKFLAAADILPIAKSVLEDTEIFCESQIIKEFDYWNEVFEDNFVKRFGQIILEDTRESLRTKNGYVVIPAIARMSRYGFWELADTLSLQEKKKFAEEIIESIISVNFATIDLFKVENAKNITQVWVELLLESWSQKILSDQEMRYDLFMRSYLLLLFRYKEIFKTDYPKLEQIITKLCKTRKIFNSPELNNNELSQLWREIINKFRTLIENEIGKRILEHYEFNNYWFNE